MSKTVKVTYQGDPQSNGEGPATVDWLGHSFVKGQATDVPADHPNMGLIKGNHHFAVAGEPNDADITEDEDAEIRSARAELDRRGVKYRANASLSNLRKALAESSDANANQTVDAPHPLLTSEQNAAAVAGEGPARTDQYTGSADNELDPAGKGKKAK